MPNSEKIIRNAEAGDDPDITIGYNDLLTELIAQYKVEEMQPGDVTARMLAEAAGITVNWAGQTLCEKAERGELVRVRVRDGRGKVIAAYRKNPDAK